MTESNAITLPLTAGFVLFPGFTGLDVVGPLEILSRTPLRCLLVASNLQPVAGHNGPTIVPDAEFIECPDLDVLVVPGGPGQAQAMEDEQLVSFLRQRAARARWVLGVCTGTLLLAKAGMLRGLPAATHWLAVAELARLGARPTRERVVWASDFLVTAAGVSSGIDAALQLVARICGQPEAERIQLSVEYDPHPPFASGHPRTADPQLVELLKQGSRFAQEDEP